MKITQTDKKLTIELEGSEYWAKEVVTKDRDYSNYGPSTHVFICVKKGK